MSYTVSVRNVRTLEKALREGKTPELDEECRHNSHVLFEILKHAPRVLPRFAELAEEQVHTIADSVAYLVRTDTIIAGGYALGPNFLPDTTQPKIHGEDGIQVHLRNDPTRLHPGWRVPQEYTQVAAEFFRCYGAVIVWRPDIRDVLTSDRNSFTPSFPLADVTAFLLNPVDLFDYKYSPEEKAKFRQRLQRDIESV